MDSSLVRKMEKAKDYAMQEGRVSLMRLQATFRGDNSDHELTYEAGKWSCNCLYFRQPRRVHPHDGDAAHDEQHGEGSHQQLEDTRKGRDDCRALSVLCLANRKGG